MEGLIISNARGLFFVPYDDQGDLRNPVGELLSRFIIWYSTDFRRGEVVMINSVTYVSGLSEDVLPFVVMVP